MKSKEHKKGKENTIGKIIYSFMLFAPLIAITSTILVNTFNSQAKNENEIVYKYETNEVNSRNDIKVGNIYHYFSYIEFPQTTQRFSMTAIYNYKTTNLEGITYKYLSSYSVLDVLQNDKGYIRVAYGNDFQINLYDSNNTLVSGITSYMNNTQFSNIASIEFDFVYRSVEDIQYLINMYPNVSRCENIPIERVESKNVSNVFYDAVSKVENSDLFNWATTSAIYTGISATATALSITNTFIPMLLTYWLIISVLYFLYDIILMMLNILHRRIHDLQDSLC